MPLFVKSRLLFIHIPKSGGSSIEKLLESTGESVSLFTPTGSIFINGHTPQHCTYRELADLNLVNEDVRVFTVIRDPVERTVSEYFYIKKHRPDIDARYRNFSGFLDYFLDRKNQLLFDNHNLSNFDYLVDHSGHISDRITIFKYFDTEGIENFIGHYGLANLSVYKTEKHDLNIKMKHLKRIRKYFDQDYINFEYDH